MYKPQREKFSGGFKGGKKFGGDSWKKGGNDRFSDRNELHSAVCAECGKDCQVPFKPNGKKPIFCSNCFVKDESAGPKRFGDRGDRDSRPERRSFDRPSSDGRPNDDQFKVLNAKLDVIIKALGARSDYR